MTRLVHWIDDHIDTQPRTIWLQGAVDGDMLCLVAKGLHLFRGKSVHIYLNSTGGEEDAGLAIYDLIRSHTGRVTITVAGTAESMAAIVLQAADRRLITQNSYLMIHQGEVSPPDSHKKNVKAFLRIADLQDDTCDAILLKRIQKKYPKYSWTKFLESTHFDVYFTAAEALRWGLVDGIIK